VEKLSSALILPLGLLLFGCGKEPPKPGPLRAGVATVLLDAPVGVPLGGFNRSSSSSKPTSPYVQNFNPSHGVQSAPSARAVAFSNGLHQAALVRLDLIGVTYTLQARTSANLKAMGHELPFILMATHTHSGPARFFPPVLLEGGAGTNISAMAMDTYDTEVEDRLATSIAKAIVGALESMRPVSLGVATVETRELSRDRRCENDDLYGPGYHDPVLTLIRLDEVGEDGNPIRPLTALLHFSMHGTHLGGSNLLMAVDAPGALELAASDALGIPAVYLQGSAGDVSPAGSPHGHGAFQNSEWLGLTGQAVVLDAYQRAAPGAARPSSELRLVNRGVPLTREAMGYARGEFAEFGALGCAIGRPCDQPYVPPTSITCAALEKSPHPFTLLSALRIDDLLMVTLPGEPTTALGARAKEAALLGKGVAHAVVLGYSQDHQAYLLEEQDFMRGGYEGLGSPWGWKFGPYLIAQTEALVLGLDAEQPAHPTPALAPAVWRTPLPATAAPSVVQQAADLARLQVAKLTFEGGDAALGTPEVSLEVEADGAFVRVMASPLRPVVNGPEIVLWYAPEPTFTAAPQATARAHRWVAEWETLPTTPLGRYRLVATGRALVGAENLDYRLEGAPFQVGPSTRAATSGSATVDQGSLVVTLRFPPNPTIHSDTGQVIGHYRLRDAASAPSAGAVVQGGGLQVQVVGTSTANATLTYSAAHRAYVGPLPVGDAQSVTIPAGALVDGEGNTNGAELSLSLP
jgi:hypothetical protein